jgi:hypothetical protein
MRTVSTTKSTRANNTPGLFNESGGYVSIEANHFTKAISTNNIKWQVLPDHGRTGSALTSFPVTAPEQKPGGNASHVEYEFNCYDTGKVTINAYFSPTLNFANSENGFQYAISIDGETAQVISMNKEEKNNEAGINYKWVGENIIIRNSLHNIHKPGKHILKYWVVTPGIVLQKLVLDFGGVKQSYLGPPETELTGK